MRAYQNSVFRNNNMMFRAKIASDGTIEGFVLSNYSGGSSHMMRLHRAPDRQLYWVVEAAEGIPDRTLIFEWATAGSWDRSDLVQLGREILSLVRVEGSLEERDARLRQEIKERTGQEMPLLLPRLTHSEASAESFRYLARPLWARRYLSGFFDFRR